MEEPGGGSHTDGREKGECRRSSGLDLPPSLVAAPPSVRAIALLPLDGGAGDAAPVSILGGNRPGARRLTSGSGCSCVPPAPSYPNSWGNRCPVAPRWRSRCSGADGTGQGAAGLVSRSGCNRYTSGCPTICRSSFLNIIKRFRFTTDFTDSW